MFDTSPTIPRKSALTDIEAMRLNVGETYMALGRNAPAARARKTPSAWWCESPFKHPMGNFAVHFNLSDAGFRKVADTAKRVEYFRAFVLTGDQPIDICERLEALDLKAKYSFPGFVWNGKAKPGDEVLERNIDFAEVGETAAFIVQNFFWRSPEPARRALTQLVGAASSVQEFYSCRDEEGIAAAAVLSVTDGIVGLYNLCVREDLRSKGLGSSILSQICRAAEYRGLRLILQAEEGLVSWYGKHGFVRVAELRAYSS